MLCKFRAPPGRLNGPLRKTLTATLVGLCSAWALAAEVPTQQVRDLPTDGGQLLCTGKVFSIYAFGNGANSLELLVDMISEDETSIAAFLVGTSGTEDIASQAMFTMLNSAYAKQSPILISYVPSPGSDPRITGVYSPADHFDLSGATSCGTSVVRTPGRPWITPSLP